MAELVLAGAHASVMSCVFMGVQKMCVQVSGRHSSMKMESSKLKRHLPKAKRAAACSFTAKEDFLGVAVLDGAEVELKKVEMKDLQRCAVSCSLPHLHRVSVHIKARRDACRSVPVSVAVWSPIS
jgi:hypothetical protein